MVFQLSGGVNEQNYNRRFKSPFFSFKNTLDLASSSTLLFDYHRDNPATEKYNSFNNLSISNLSNVNITIYPNQNKDNGIIVPSGETRIFDSKIIPSTTSLLILNLSTTTSADAETINLTVWKDQTELQNVASRLHEQFFSEEPNPFITDISAFLVKMKRTI